MGNLSESNVGKILEWTYEKVINGIPGSEPASVLAESYLKKSENVEEAINSLVNYQITKCATSGFLAGLGGVVTMPVSIPANIVSVMYVQMRMVAAIAHIRGYDLKDDQVQTFVYACLTGQAASELVKDVGIKVGLKVGEAQIKRIPGEVLKQINKAVGFRLVTKFGQTGVVNLGKMIPLLGGVIGGSFDAVSTGTIATAARSTFKQNDGFASAPVLVR